MQSVDGLNPRADEVGLSQTGVEVGGSGDRFTHPQNHQSDLLAVATTNTIVRKQQVRGLRL